MLIPSRDAGHSELYTSLSRRVNANSQPLGCPSDGSDKLIKKGEC